MTYWKTQHFKALQQDWYAKLADDGFRDAEELIGDEMLLRQVAEHVFRGTDQLRATAKADYFRLLRDRVRNEAFRSKTDRIILLLRAEGAKIQQIVDTLKLLGKRRCRVTVRVTIRKYEMAWDMRDYTPKQLNKKVARSA